MHKITKIHESQIVRQILLILELVSNDPTLTFKLFLF
jgi:hypothetical protein